MLDALGSNANSVGDVDLDTYNDNNKDAAGDGGDDHDLDDRASWFW